MAQSLPYGRVGGKRRTRRGPKGGRFDDIDDADDIDDPRTEGRRRKVRQFSRTPEGARKAEGGGCGLRRGASMSSMSSDRRKAGVGGSFP